MTTIEDRPIFSPTPRRGAIMARGTLILAAVVLMAGCTARRTDEFPPVIHRDPMLLGPGDILEIRYPSWPDLTMVEQPGTLVRPDGKISVPLAGDVQAAGRTPMEVADSIKEAFGQKMHDPTVAVIVSEVSRQVVTVGGEVRTPGQIPLNREMTAMEAIFAVGGFVNRTARSWEVYIVRHKNGERFSQLVDLGQPLAKSLDPPVYLEPGDVVYVPRRRMDRANQWVDQFISRMLPSIPIRIPLPD